MNGVGGVRFNLRGWLLRTVYIQFKFASILGATVKKGLLNVLSYMYLQAWTTVANIYTSEYYCHASGFSVPVKRVSIALLIIKEIFSARNIDVHAPIPRSRIVNGTKT